MVSQSWGTIKYLTYRKYQFKHRLGLGSKRMLWIWNTFHTQFIDKTNEMYHYMLKGPLLPVFPWVYLELKVNEAGDGSDNSDPEFPEYSKLSSRV